MNIRWLSSYLYVVFYNSSGLTYDEYKDRCDAKIDDLRPAEEERVRGEEKVKYCQYIDCTTIQATKLCPEECSKSNKLKFV